MLGLCNIYYFSTAAVVTRTLPIVTLYVHFLSLVLKPGGRVQLKCDGTWWRTGGEVKGKLANGVGSQYSHTTSERGLSSITTTYAHTPAASSRLN
jgi:hypothetical protein